MDRSVRRLATRFAPLVTLLVVAMSASAQPAFSAGVKGEVIRDRFTIPPGERRTIEVECPQGFRVVAGYVVKLRGGGGGTNVSESRRLNDGAWVFSVSNHFFRADEIVVEVLCVRLSEEGARFRAKIRLEHRDRSVGVLEPGESVDVRVDCPGGYAPVGWGYLETDVGPGTQPPPMNADSRIATAEPFRGGVLFLVQNSGSEAYQGALQAVCVDRRSRAGDQVVLTQTVRETTKFEVPALGDEIVRARCAAGGVAVGAGWALPEQTPLFPFPLGWNGDNRFGTGFVNANSLPERGKAYQLCLNAAVM